MSTIDENGRVILSRDETDAIAWQGVNTGEYEYGFYGPKMRTDLVEDKYLEISTNTFIDCKNRSTDAIVKHNSGKRAGSGFDYCMLWPEPVVNPDPNPVPDPIPDPIPDPVPDPTPDPTPVPDPTPTPTPTPTPVEPTAPVENIPLPTSDPNLGTGTSTLGRFSSRYMHRPAILTASQFNDDMQEELRNLGLDYVLSKEDNEYP